jgi:serine/threonine protein kinase
VERTDASSRARFFREARAAAALDAETVARIHSVGETPEGRPYLVMEYVAGGALNSWLAGHVDEAGPRFEDEFDTVAGFIRDAACGLAEVHAAGLVHRDVKPANILIDEKSQRAKITDFGVARVIEDAVTITQSAELVGTPVYMSPEQANDSQEVTALSDVYSLGAALFESITAQPVFRGTTQAVLRQIERDEPSRPCQLNEHIPRDLETICLKALEKSPEKRYPSAIAFADDLDRFLTRQPIHARPVGPLGRASRWVSRNPSLSLLATLLTLSLVAGSVVSTGLWLQSRANFAQAETRAEQLGESQKRMRTAVDSFHRRMFEGESLYWQMTPAFREEMLRDVLSYLNEFSSDETLSESERLALVEDYFAVARVSRELGHQKESRESAESAYRIASEVAAANADNVTAWALRSDSASILAQNAIETDEDIDVGQQWARIALNSVIAADAEDEAFAAEVRQLRCELGVILTGAYDGVEEFEVPHLQHVVDELRRLVMEVRQSGGHQVEDLEFMYKTIFLAVDELAARLDDVEALNLLLATSIGANREVEKYVELKRSRSSSVIPGHRQRAHFDTACAKRFYAIGEYPTADSFYTSAIRDYENIMTISPQNRVWRAELAEVHQQYAELQLTMGNAAQADRHLRASIQGCVNLLRTDEADWEARIRFIGNVVRLHRLQLAAEDPSEAINSLRYAAGDCRLLMNSDYAPWAMELRIWALATAYRIAVDCDHVQAIGVLEASMDHWLDTIADAPQDWLEFDSKEVRTQLYGESPVVQPDLLL